LGFDFLSNGGVGPYMARIISKDARNTTLVYRRPDQSMRRKTTLPTWFLASPSCGWKRPKDTKEGE